MAEKVSDTIDIEATTEEIFDVAVDLESYPEWNANIKEVEVVEWDDDERPSKAWFKVDAKIRTVAYTLAYDFSAAPDSFSWKLVDGDVKALEGSYSFEEFDDVTEVTYEMAIDPGFPVPGFLKKQAERQIVKGALDDLKKRVESG